ncbi:MAG: hypothetical protein FWC66_10060 [Oscillospiraceae bacterium]|nr:hypothetical protein [Oscillospiraceae bacterium]
MSENLHIYEKSRNVPDAAKKSIQAGRLKGYTDINPMWRVKILTEMFGPCGVGWLPTITRQWVEPGADGAVCAFVNIDLKYKYNGAWSEPVSATGGSELVSKERNGLYTNDEAYKMAYTDAISVACKLLGVGADVYWEKDCSKYDKSSSQESLPPTQKNMSANAAANYTLSFGTHSGKTLREIYNDKESRSYLDWLLKQEKTDSEVKQAVSVMIAAVNAKKQESQIPPPTNPDGTNRDEDLPF